MPHSSRLRAIAKVVLLLVSVSVTIVVLDVGLRMSALVAPRRGAMQPVPARHALTSWIDVFPPGYSGVLSGPDFSVKVHAGSLGLRERDLDMATLATEHPVLFLGDSYFFGWGVEQEQRMSELLAQRFAADGARVPVVNMSFPGWGTYHYVDVWRKFVPQMKPRLVVVSTFVGNDFTDDLKQVGRDSDQGDPVLSGKGSSIGITMRAKLAVRELISTSPIVSLVNRALLGSPAFRRLFNGLEIRNDRIALYETSGSELQSQLYGATESAMDTLAQLSHADNVPVLVVVIPDHLQVLMPALFEGYAIDKPQRELDAMLGKRGIPTFDLLPVFQHLQAPDTMFFREDKHWNVNGHALVADALHDRLRGLLGPVDRQVPPNEPTDRRSGDIPPGTRSPPAPK